MTLAPDDPRHGTITGYQNHRCRCEPCRAAKSDYNRSHYVPRPRKAPARAPFATGPERERDTRAWNGRIGAEYGCVVTFENDGGEAITLHREGWPETALGSLCDEALRIDGSLRLVSYSSPQTILADVTGPPTRSGRYREATVLGQIGRLGMLHPRLRGRSLTTERKYRAVDALKR